MNNPPPWTAREESLLLLNAYIDNELDAASVLDVERRIDLDATLKAELSRLTELRTALSAHVGKERASDALRRRIAATVEAPNTGVVPTPRPRTSARSFDWRQMAAAAAAAAFIASAGTYIGLHQTQSNGEIAEIVAGHQRSLLATSPFDVASSDRHTVKPWFDGKLAVSPQIIDLADAGFPLVGGRVDVVDGHPVPTIVYKRHAHLISLTAVPKPGSKDGNAPPTHATRDGYTLVVWPGRDFTYSAVSDVARSELDEFVSRFRDVSKSP
jgi:anti-sigma factor RsiW